MPVQLPASAPWWRWYRCCSAWLACFIANIPVSILGGLVPSPLLALVPVYFWCLVRPDLMTPAVALTIGFGEDVMSGGPPGVWTLSFVLAYALVAAPAGQFCRPVGPGGRAGLCRDQRLCLRRAPGSRWRSWPS